MANLGIPTYEDVKSAALRLKGHIKETPILRHDRLDEISGLKLFLKNETAQKTGTFKYRGAFSRLSALNEAQKQQGVVAFSSGNHAQGVALAAKELGISAIIVMPKTAPLKKKQGTRSHGATIVEYDPKTQVREEIAAQIGARDNRIVVPAYDDAHVISGQGSVGKEICEYFSALDTTLDALITPVGGGGLCAGISLSMQALSPKTKIYAAEPINYDDTYRSLQLGARVANANPPPTLCDALMSPSPGEITFSINQHSLSGVFRVTDQECLQAMAWVHELLGVTIEPGGSVALAAALSGQTGIAQGSTIAIVLSGGNVDDDVMALALQTKRD
ncbi:MAG: pyridoxal-5'-phosphate-dependent protein [Robiginitomaculum sp.]|nr:MAG: pyridoxal-5'-phosphate-dependent protein [Robiginitomaculum sp.]